jgi:LysM repeat protein
MIKNVYTRYTNLFILIVGLLSVNQSVAQQVIDTIDSDKGKIIIYANKTWEYVQDVGFDGILNRELHNKVTQDPSLSFFQNWNNGICYTSGRKNDMNKIKDTFPIWILNAAHPIYHPPVKGTVTSRYGYRSGRHHSGIDLDLDIGDTVRAAWDGKVRYAKYNDGGFGNLVIVRHFNGLETFYAHLSKLCVVPDQDVKAGDLLGLGGNTGRSFGPHLHFEVRFFDAAMNPEEVIDFTKFVCKDSVLNVNKHIFVPGAKPSTQSTTGTVVKEEESAEDDGHQHEEEVEVITDEKKEEKKPVVEPNKKKYYKIQRGDTLTEIAARHHTTVSKLCQLNGIRPSSSLHVGKSLRVK